MFIFIRKLALVDLLQLIFQCLIFMKLKLKAQQVLPNSVLSKKELN